MVAEVTLLLSVFIAFMGISILNNGQRLYVRQPLISVLYFGLGSALIATLFPQTYKLFSLPVFGIIAGALLVSATLYFLTKRTIPPPTEFLKTHGEKNVFITLSYPFIFSKGAEIFFQQICFATLVLILSSLGLHLIEILCCTAVSMCMTHLPLLRTHGFQWGGLYAIAGLLFGAIAPIFILLVPYGFAYSFGLHVMGYVIGGCFLWFLKSRG